MNTYPAELVTPPLALVALLGSPELHGAVGEFLRSHHKPPINVIGAADVQSAGRLFGDRKPSTPHSTPPPGVLKSDWFAKHRQRRPAVAVVFLERDAVVGDPTSWARVCAQLDTVRAATRSRGGRVVIVVVQGPGAGELPEERTSVLCRQAGIDRKCVSLLSLAEGDGSLKRLGRILYEQAGLFYLDESRRLLSLHSERRAASPDLNCRMAFKAAALAEFRADWATAVKTYQTAYAEVQKLPYGGVPLPLQRWYEVTAVAEQVHVKVVTLLLHQHRTSEALAHFRHHITLFRKPPFEVPPGLAAAQWGWLARQYAVMGELLSSRVDPANLLPQRDSHPAYLFLCSANAAVERRRAWQRAKELRGGVASPLRIGAIDPGRFVGQLVVREPARRLTDAEFVQHLEVSEAQVNHAQVAIQTLSTAHELYKRGPLRAGRLIYHIGALMAREHLVADDTANARRLLESVAGIYRRERWEVPLAGALLELRECAQRQNTLKEHIAYSLELASLQHALDLAQRTTIAQAAIIALQAATSLAPASSPTASPRKHVSLGGVSSAKDAASDAPITSARLEYHMRPGNNGLLSCLALQAGFQPLADDAAPDAVVHFGLALWSNLPVELPVSRAEVVFADRDGSFRVPAHRSSSGAVAGVDELMRGLSMASVRTSEANSAASVGDALQLPSQQWQRLWARWQPRVSGKAQAQHVVLYIGPSAALVWPLAPFPPGQAQLGTSAESLAAKLAPWRWEAVSPGLYELDLPSQHAAPQLRVEGAGYAMVGEQVPVDCVILAADALVQPTLAVSAQYLEGVGEPSLLRRPGLDHPSDQPLGQGGSGADAGQPLEGAVALADLPAGGCHRVRLLMGVERTGQIHVSARLTYLTAQVKGEACDSQTVLEMVVERPFQLDCTVSAPARLQSLLMPQQREADGASATQAMGSAQSVPALPVGQACVLTAAIRMTAPCEVYLHSVCLDPANDADEAVDLLDASCSDPRAPPVLLRKGDIHTCLFRLRHDRPAEALSLGTAQLTWRRLRPPQRRTSTSGGGNSRSGSPVRRSRVDGGDIGDVREIRTSLPLPTVAFQQPVISVQADFPARANAGVPFTYQLRLTNATELLQEVAISIGETSGFVFAGDRLGATAVLPKQDMLLTWRLVAYNAGPLQLPEVVLTALRCGASISVSKGRRVFVVPAVPNNQASR
ncbi:hypothetical protein WJX72_000478 [[Myrmecia] bisecta]|uniref:Trafficking protein particle complex subunit 11 domain-containing protein n=1 Tax=[Myrmecia] bisecta TaxID=41462 RepID=A0AAW1PFX7_9CHLO